MDVGGQRDNTAHIRFSQCKKEGSIGSEWVMWGHLKRLRRSSTVNGLGEYDMSYCWKESFNCVTDFVVGVCMCVCACVVLGGTSSLKGIVYVTTVSSQAYLCSVSRVPTKLKMEMNQLK